MSFLTTFWRFEVVIQQMMFVALSTKSLSVEPWQNRANFRLILIVVFSLTPIC